MRRIASFAFALAWLMTGCGEPRAAQQPLTAGQQPTTVAPTPTPKADAQPPDPKVVPPPVAPLADQVLRAHGQADTVVSDLLLQVKDPNDSFLFQLSLWCPADGRIRLTASKNDFDFIQALVQRDGTFVAELVRSHEVVRGNLRDISVLDAQGKPSGPPFLAYLALLVAECKVGPLPDKGPYRSAPPIAGAPARSRGIEVKDPVSGLTSQLTVAPDDTAVAKRILDPPGTEALRFEYGHYQHFDQLERPARMRLVVPGDTSEYAVRLRKLDVVPAISDERMHFTPSPGDREIPLEEFLKRLRE